ncbi:MAG: thiol-disulfide oxidoreductase DCC family protein [Flavobacteriaceae bacterium]|nr:thiol-disulfide oxidoreductase DCC family protein [Flavobacteriaceae bacterium]
MKELPLDKKLILFDGVCNLCNNSVNFVIRHDKKDRFMFASLQSELGKQIAKEKLQEAIGTDSIILVENDSTLFLKSTAALKIAAALRFPINLLVIFLIIPKALRNWVYDYVAKNRYKWYGKRDACMIPTDDIKSKFLE